MERTTGIILAGGRGTRLGGVNKALMEVGGRAIIDRQLEVLRPLTEEVLVVANDDALASRGLRIVRDVEQGAGPLVGLYSGLREVRTPLAIAVACDLPFLQPELLRFLIAAAAGYDVVIPRLGDLLEPAHAVYRTGCVPAMAAAIRRGERRLIAFLGRLRVREVGEKELRRYDPNLRSFLNVNTPEELARAQRLAAGDL